MPGSNLLPTPPPCHRHAHLTISCHHLDPHTTVSNKLLRPDVGPLDLVGLGLPHNRPPSDRVRQAAHARRRPIRPSQTRAISQLSPLPSTSDKLGGDNAHPIERVGVARRNLRHPLTILSMLLGDGRRRRVDRLHLTFHGLGLVETSGGAGISLTSVPLARASAQVFSSMSK